LAILKKKQLREMTDVDMVKRKHELKLELAKDEGQIAIGGSPVNPGRTGEIKKTIARILTEQKRRGQKTA
jgi:large subunit ribosomal protein L29